MNRKLELVAFIRRCLPSVWALELLLLMRRPPPRTWSAAELVGELRASDAVVSGVLAGFERDGLVSSAGEGRWRFAPEGEGLDGLCDALASAYSERPVAVINAIAAQDDTLQSLADAFSLKRRDP